MRLLVTRPQPDANRTASRLRAAGHTVLVQPMLSPEYLSVDTPGDPAAIALTSRNGVRALAFMPNAARWTRIPLFAVGEATAAAARSAGFADVRSANRDSASLAALISSTLDPAAGTVLYPAAEDRVPDLEDGLRAKGFRVHAAIAYRMRPARELGAPVADALRDRALDGVLIYSARTARAFAALMAAAGLNDALAALQIYAISRATAEAVAWPEAVRVRVAEHPTEDAIFQLFGQNSAA